MNEQGMFQAITAINNQKCHFPKSYSLWIIFPKHVIQVVKNPRLQLSKGTWQQPNVHCISYLLNERALFASQFTKKWDVALIIELILN